MAAYTIPDQVIDLTSQSLIEQEDVVSFFNLMTSLIATPEIFTNLPVSEQTTHFEKIKNLSRYERTTCNHQYCGCHGTHHNIYRPIYRLPESWSFYKKYMDETYPRGEHKSVIELEMTVANYRMLYYWITGACTRCGSHQLSWEEGDKHLEYYCHGCRDETCFIKGAWAYM
jgi:hypothetical protein